LCNKLTGLNGIVNVSVDQGGKRSACSPKNFHRWSDYFRVRKVMPLYMAHGGGLAGRDAPEVVKML